MNGLNLLHQAFFGGVAAVAFGVLFNFPRRWLPLSFAAGAVALGVRTGVLEAGHSLPFASFLAALTISVGAELWRKGPDLTRAVLAVVGCIPMVPGSLASKGILGYFQLAQMPTPDAALLVETTQNLAKFTLTIAVMGTALMLPSLFRRALVPGKDAKRN